MSYPGGAPPPSFPPYGGPAPLRKKSSAPAVVVIVCVVALVLCCGGAGAAGLFFYAKNKQNNAERKLSSMSSSLSAYTVGPSAPRSTYSSRSSVPPSARTGTSARSAPDLSVGECVQVSRTSDQVFSEKCLGGAGTYQVVQVAPSGGCPSNQRSFHDDSYSYCLKPHFEVNHCYQNPEDGDWILPTPNCKAGGTILVFDVITGSTDHSECSGLTRTSYRYLSWENPPQAICYWVY